MSPKETTAPEPMGIGRARAGEVPPGHIVHSGIWSIIFRSSGEYSALQLDSWERTALATYCPGIKPLAVKFPRLSDFALAFPGAPVLHPEMLLLWRMKISTSASGSRVSAS